MNLSPPHPVLPPARPGGPAGRRPGAAGGDAPFLVRAASAGELQDLTAAWDDLARHTLEPNAFYEPWMLLPALRAFGAGLDVRVVLVVANTKTPVVRHGQLCGLFPLVRRRGCRGLPVRVLALWQHLYCFSCVPLLRAGCAGEALDAFLGWLAGSPWGAGVLEMGQVGADGPFQSALADRLHARAALSYQAELYPRALLRPGGDPEEYLCQALNSKRRTELRRQEKHLGGQGRLEYRLLEKAGELDHWVEAFLALENSGWKGKKGTALEARAADAAYFRAVTAAAFARGQLQMLGLFLDGRPVAMKCNFLAGAGGFAFKIAYDEALARFSPGVLLEVAGLRQAHRTPGLEWVDSCALPDHPMINRLWTERRLVQSLVISTGRAPGDLVVSLLPLLRWLRRKLRWRPWPFSR